MIAVTYWEGWVRAHPVTLLVFGALAAACVLALAACLWLTGDPEAPRRDPPRSRAGGTRARRHALLGSACRRAAAIRAWATSWFWWLDSWPAAREQLTAAWARARRQVSVRARGITIAVTGDRSTTNVPGRDGKRPDPPPTSGEAPVSNMRPDTHLYGGPGHPAGDLPPLPGASWPGEHLTVKVAPAERDTAAAAALAVQQDPALYGPGLAAEIQATRPWADDTGTFTRIVAGE